MQTVVQVGLAEVAAAAGAVLQARRALLQEPLVATVQAELLVALVEVPPVVPEGLPCAVLVVPLQVVMVEVVVPAALAAPAAVAFAALLAALAALSVQTVPAVEFPAVLVVAAAAEAAEAAAAAETAAETAAALVAAVQEVAATVVLVAEVPPTAGPPAVLAPVAAARGGQVLLWPTGQGMPSWNLDHLLQLAESDPPPAGFRSRIE